MRKLTLRHFRRTRPSIWLPAAIRRLAAAERAWCEYSIARHDAGTDSRDGEWYRLDYEAEAAYSALPARVARIISRRIRRQLGYRRRTGQQ